MAENDDKDAKSKDPTEKKLSDARDEGNVPISREMGTSFIFIGALFCLMFIHPLIWQTIAVRLRQLIVASANVPLRSTADISEVLASSIAIYVMYCVPIASLLALLGIAAFVTQGAFGLHPKKIAPDWSRISIIKGWGRLASSRAFVEFSKACVKMLVIGGVITAVIAADVKNILAVSQTDVLGTLSVIGTLSAKILIVFVGFSSILTAVDIAFVRRTWWRDLMMTHQEMKDEHKNSEGDPLVKMRIRNLFQARRKRQMLRELPKATFIIANPTHFAIALRYAREDGSAPVVVAKGVESLALRIRQKSKGYGIPLIENRQLVRAMYPLVEVGETIPEEFYKAVAEIIVWIQSRSSIPLAGGV